jgi:hypothetical protein
MPEDEHAHEAASRWSDGTVKNIVAALAKAQGEFPPIHKDKEVVVTTKSGGKYSFRYAPLETVMEKVRPVLSTNGIAIMQHVTETHVQTFLLHVSGEWLSSPKMKIMTDEAGGMQAMGSAITYAKRYTLCAMLGVVADDDDDGNTAAGNEVRVTKDNTADGKRDAVVKALTGGSVAENVKGAEFLRRLRDAAKFGTAAMKSVWNGGTKADRLAIAEADMVAMKTVAAAVDQNPPPGPETNT